jgi:hypothetical protein
MEYSTPVQQVAALVFLELEAYTPVSPASLAAAEAYTPVSLDSQVAVVACKPALIVQVVYTLVAVA